ncbi:MAG: hypothetical protein JWO37_1051 [Acidimicrobiales bacterium]|jgi:hypothetical protein|nr:hypothetical protein [Acidimicrobiales bacterium]
MSGEAGLPVDDYDALTASAILSVLDWLSPSELATISRHERQHKQRVSILRRIDKLTVPAPDDLVIDLRDHGAGTCLLCGKAVESAAAFIGHLKHGHGLADDPGFESSLPDKLFAPVVPMVADDAPRRVRSAPVLDRVLAVGAAPSATAHAHDGAAVSRSGPVVDPYDPPARRSAELAVPRLAAPSWRQVARSSWMWLAGFGLVFVLVMIGVVLLIAA